MENGLLSAAGVEAGGQAFLYPLNRSHVETGDVSQLLLRPLPPLAEHFAVQRASAGAFECFL